MPVSAEGRVEHKRQLCCRLVEFLVFNSIHWEKSDAFNIEDRVEYYVICKWPLMSNFTVIRALQRDFCQKLKFGISGP